MTPQAVAKAARRATRESLTSAPDERLTDLARAGNERAFEAIVARYREPLLRYSRRLLPASHRHRAEDVVQQALAKAYRALGREDERELKLRAWLYRIAHNEAISAIRNENWDHVELTDSFDGPERPDEACERRSQLADVLHSVRALPETQRVALVRRELAGESHEAIAADLGMSRGAVRQLIYRARSSLRSTISVLLPAPLLSRLRWLGGSPAEAGGAELAAGVAGTALKLAVGLLAVGALGLGGTKAITTALGDPGRESRVSFGSAHKIEPSKASLRARRSAHEDDRQGADSGSKHDTRGTSDDRRGAAGSSGAGEPGDDHGDAGEAGDDHGRGGESGDDHGATAEPGDDHGATAEPADDSGGAVSGSGADDLTGPTVIPDDSGSGSGSGRSGADDDPV